MIIYYSGAENSYGELSDKTIDGLSVMMTYAKLGGDEASQSYRFWKLLQRRRKHASADQTSRRADKNRK